MLDLTLDPTYNLSKNRLLLLWILQMIVDMVNDSTPLIIWSVSFFEVSCSIISKKVR